MATRVALIICLCWFALPNSPRAAESPFARITDVTPIRFQFGPQESYLLASPSALIMPHLELDIGLGSSFLSNALVVVNMDSGRIKRSLLRSQSRMEMAVFMGLFDKFEFGIRIPVVLSQRSQHIGFGLEPLEPSSSLGDLEAITTWQPLKQGGFPVNVATSITLVVPTGDESSYNSRNQLSGKLQVAASRLFGHLLHGVNAGIDYLPAKTLPDQTDGTRFTMGMGSEYLHRTQETDHRFTIELNGYAPIQEPTQSQFGAAVGFGYGLTAFENWQFSTQLHTALTPSFGLPTYQGQLAIAYRHLTHRRPPRCVNNESYLFDDRCPPPDTDKDGVPDTVDLCPTAPEDMDQFEDKDGCPDPDNDQDGLPDEEDKCPNKTEDKDGFKDDDGCPDPDNDLDGIPDPKDECPLLPESKNGFDDEDGCPEPDDDNDTIPNAYDRCPAEPEDIDQFEDKDGCPDPDNDQDGILDPKDLCPNEPEDMNGVRDDDGCPDAILAVKTQKEIVITDKILFIHGQVIPRKVSRPILSAVKDILLKYPTLTVEIEGHTDDYGGADFNRYLSQARAQAVLDAIVRLGGKGSSLRRRLSAVGFGKARPAASNETKEGRAKNRRVIFRIVDQ